MLHGEEDVVDGDAGYQGTATGPEMEGKPTEFRGAMRPGKRRALPNTPEGRLQDLAETAKNHIRSKGRDPSGCRLERRLMSCRRYATDGGDRHTDARRNLSISRASSQLSPVEKTARQQGARRVLATSPNRKCTADINRWKGEEKLTSRHGCHGKLGIRRFNAMLNPEKSVAQTLKLILAVALPVLISSCASPKAKVPAGNVAIDGNCAIDGQGRSKGKVSFNGWAVGNPKVAPENITVAISDGEPITATLYDRPDIAQAYQTQALTKTGFRVEVEETKAAPGSVIKIFANQSDKVHQCIKTFNLK